VSAGSTIVAGAAGATVVIPASSSSSDLHVIIPVARTTTNAAGSTIVTQILSTSSITASVQVAITTTNAAGSVVTTSSAIPAIVLTTTNSRGSTIVTTSPLPTAGPVVNAGTEVVTTTDQFGESVVLSATSGQVVTTTDARGHTFTTTYHPSGGAVRSLILQTVIGVNGQPQVLTSYAIVLASGAQAVQTDGGASVAATGTARPSLQASDASLPRELNGVLAILLSAVLGFALLL